MTTEEKLIASMLKKPHALTPLQSALKPAQLMAVFNIASKAMAQKPVEQKLLDSFFHSLDEAQLAVFRRNLDSEQVALLDEIVAARKS